MTTVASNYERVKIETTAFKRYGVNARKWLLCKLYHCVANSAGVPATKNFLQQSIVVLSIIRIGMLPSILMMCMRLYREFCLIIFSFGNSKPKICRPGQSRQICCVVYKFNRIINMPQKFLSSNVI